MTGHAITLDVPDHILKRARQLAEEQAQSVEDLLIKHLESTLMAPLPKLPPDEEAELDALHHLSDDALWTIAREQMPASRQERMQVLMDGNNQGTLSKDEREELAGLVDSGQKLMLRKAQAAALLTERGYRVTIDSFDDLNFR